MSKQPLIGDGDEAIYRAALPHDLQRLGRTMRIMLDLYYNGGNEFRNAQVLADACQVSTARIYQLFRKASSVLTHLDNGGKFGAHYYAEERNAR